MEVGGVCGLDDNVSQNALLQKEKRARRMCAVTVPLFLLVDWITLLLPIRSFTLCKYVL